MAPLTDPNRLAAYKDALGNWKYEGYIQFELTETAHKWFRREFNNLTLKEIGRLMFEYVTSGGDIDEVRETRPEWCNFDFHHDLRIPIKGKTVYIETRLFCSDPFVAEDSTILVVNIHER